MGGIVEHIRLREPDTPEKKDAQQHRNDDSGRPPLHICPNARLAHGLTAHR
jgi:hypothetical protein